MKIRLFFIFALVAIATFFIFQNNSHTSSKDFIQYSIKQAKIGNKNYYLYLADTEDKRTSGLSNKTIQVNEGMVFTFAKSGFYQFWMKDMKYPLDFIYLNHDIVVDYKTNISPSTYPNSFTSGVVADKIIELRAGEIQNSAIKKGQRINF